MKRSKMVTLVAMGSAALSLSGCDQPSPNQNDTQVVDDIAPPVTTYASVDDCISKAVFTEKYCRDQFAQAQKVHAENAPRFNSEQECAAQFGADACQVQSLPATGTGQVVAPSATMNAGAGGSSGSGSFWMPAMTGFILGQALGGGREVEHNYYSSPKPLYRNPNVYSQYKDPRYKPNYYREEREAYSGSVYGYGGNAGTYSRPSDYSSSNSSYNRRAYPSSDSYSSNKGVNSYKPAQQRTQVVAKSGFGARASGFGFGG